MNRWRAGEGCEWNPDADKQAMGTDRHWLTIDATLSVGTGHRNLHLCAGCAALPRFKHWKTKPLNRAAGP